MTAQNQQARNGANGTEDHVRIFDTTLRDGEQAPGFSMTVGQKLRMARTLADLGVDIIEAGFAASSPGDFESVQTVSQEINGVTICSLARCVEGDIREAGKALKPAQRSRIHVFIGTSPVHREAKFNFTKEQVLEHAVASVRMACDLADEVEFSPEDAIRTERDYLGEVVAAAIDAGATTINIPDTVGYTTPAEIKELFEGLRADIGNDAIVLSTHCHDDLGLAAANSLAAVKGGARQIECAINGIGERAGNCSLEEVVMALKVRADHFGVDTQVNTNRLYGASRLLATLTGQPVSRNKAIVGRNAFVHEAGIHQHGVLKNRETYEIMKPEDVGVSRDNLILGKHSGRAAIAERAKRLGFDLGDNQLQSVFVAFKDLADTKKEVFDSDLEALILGETAGNAGPWRISGMHSGTGYGEASTPYGSIELINDDGEKFREAGEGDGPIDAIFSAIDKITGVSLELEDFTVRSVSSGEDALGEADVHVWFDGRRYHGRGVNTDIVAAGASAYLDVVNRILRQRDRLAAQKAEQAAATGEAARTA
ncbi:MAG: 2-isopropylmalate synthase [Maricaulaceae bacterium]|jgi:2-isopropylmalate synthase